MENIVLLSYWGGRMLDYQGAEIYVDHEGRRFVDETTTTSKIARAILQLPGRSMYVITDAKSAKGVNVGAKITAGSIRLSESIAQMARDMKVPVSELERTIRLQRSCCRTNPRLIRPHGLYADDRQAAVLLGTGTVDDSRYARRP